ncbi:dynactin-associated protein [Notamacropus eugenii]|uniref:dynactin-associated protein n=1 Tax=Notamacropus eugenii TaxID=9315 RepID=UPI003B66B557
MEGKYRKHPLTPEQPGIQTSFQNPSGQAPFQSQAVFHSQHHGHSEIDSRPFVVCTNPGVLGQSASSTIACHQGKEWSLWKIFLACLLACVITTTIGVLILSLVKSNFNNNSPIIIQLPQKAMATTASTAITTSSITSMDSTTATVATTTIASTTDASTSATSNATLTVPNTTTSPGSSANTTTTSSDLATPTP